MKAYVGSCVFEKLKDLLAGCQLRLDTRQSCISSFCFIYVIKFFSTWSFLFKMVANKQLMPVVNGHLLVSTFISYNWVSCISLINLLRWVQCKQLTEKYTYWNEKVHSLAAFSTRQAKYLKSMKLFKITSIP